MPIVPQERANTWKWSNKVFPATVPAYNPDTYKSKIYFYETIPIIFDAKLVESLRTYNKICYRLYFGEPILWEIQSRQNTTANDLNTRPTIYLHSRVVRIRAVV